jgi:2,3-bisphosphoglycerate-independent phosphoglycerate mutase
MKYLVLIPDGMADRGVEKLGGKTPLEAADTPNMDFIARNGMCGMAKTVPEGFEPGSDIAILTIFGVDVKRYYTGRGPIEALARGISGKYVFRCNLVKVEHGIMVDYSGGRMGDDEAKRIIEALNREIGVRLKFVKFHTGRSYRNLLVVNRYFEGEVKTHAPHDIQGKKIEEYLPSGGELARLLRDLIAMSESVIRKVTLRANMIWPWSGGKMPEFPSFRKMYGVKGAVISEVDLVEGIARGMKMSVLNVDGLTGYIDTNYRGLVRKCVEGLDEFDLVVLHTEGIDEVGHEGDAERKVEGISIYDEKIVGKLLDKIDLEETRILLTPDHPTPVDVRTHVAEPVPLAVYGLKKDDVRVYSEKACRKGRIGLVDGKKLLPILLSR